MDRVECVNNNIKINRIPLFKWNYCVVSAMTYGITKSTTWTEDNLMMQKLQAIQKQGKEHASNINKQVKPKLVKRIQHKLRNIYILDIWLRGKAPEGHEES